MSRRVARAAAAGMAVVMLAGCGNDGNQEQSPEETAASSSSSSAVNEPGEATFATPEDADRRDAESTAETAAMMLHSWDTATDRTQTAAAIRARPLMTDEWAAEQVEPERNGARGAWLEPTEHEAYSVPTVTPAQSDAAAGDYGADRAAFTFTVSWTWLGRDGEVIDNDESETMTIYLERDKAGQWAVAGHTVM